MYALVDMAAVVSGPTVLTGFPVDRGSDSDKCCSAADMITVMNNFWAHVVGDTVIHFGKALSTLAGPGEVVPVANNVVFYTDLIYGAPLGYLLGELSVQTFLKHYDKLGT